MEDQKKGPIEEVVRGKYIIQGKEHSQEGEKKGAGKDIRIIGTEVSEWKERTGHILRPEMITGVFGIGIEALVIGTGFDGAIEVKKETIEEIRDYGIRDIIIEKTPDACKKYNELYVKGVKVAMLAHGTC
jgi:hypothetical protein